MNAPFKLPVFIEDFRFLLAADSELIADLQDATPEEQQFIVWCINQQQEQAL